MFESISVIVFSFVSALVAVLAMYAVCGVIVWSVFGILDELDKKRQEAQYQARMRKNCPDGLPFQGRWYTGENGKRFWLNWWNVPVCDL